MNLVFKLYKLSQRYWAGSRNPSSTILQKKTDYDQSPLMKCSSPKFVLWAFARDLIGQSALGLFVGFLSKTLMRGD